MPLKKSLLSLASTAEETFDALAAKLRRRLGSDKPLLIVPYRGYGTAEVWRLKARVLRAAASAPSTAEDNMWQNLLNTYRHIESNEVPHATVRAQYGAWSADFAADEEGYVDIEIRLPAPPTADLWHEVTLTLVAVPNEAEIPAVAAVAEVLVPPPTAAFGVISDIDDTVLQSSATNYLKAAELMFLQNAHTRQPFEGVAELYHALHADGRNPIFYVSSSPWNLYDLLTDFFTYNDIPAGPLFLKDYGITADQFLSAGHGAHKLAQIDAILGQYPTLPFVLMGDSGQKDPEIYSEVVARYPGRITAVYIRDVSADARDAAVEAIAAEVSAQGVPMIFVPDSATARAHAAGLGLVEGE